MLVHRKKGQGNGRIFARVFPQGFMQKRLHEESLHKACIELRVFLAFSWRFLGVFLGVIII
jgi:hypothetical protein